MLDSCYGGAGFMLRVGSIHVTGRFDSCCGDAEFLLRGRLIRVDWSLIHATGRLNSCCEET